ncbi:odorant receptor Or1-like [Tribolium madens]|uniref:odorant receptor Or1-like n=1 Tax=Tribolium madens TaxID=41895 RepID=UPI001CF75DDC|nr:odorant receptor Or1-like [Tribolium madens]
MDNTDIDLTEFVIFNINSMHFFGYFLPEFAKNSKKKIFYVIYAVTFVGTTFGLSLVSEIANMINSFGDIERMTDASFLLLTNLVQCFKMYSFINHGPRVWNLIHSMNSIGFKPKNIEQRIILVKEITMSKRISKTFFMACTIVCSLWGISPFIDRGSYEKLRLPLSGWYPYSTDTSPAYEITYAYQTLTTWINGLADVAMDTFMSGIIMVIAAELSLLNDSLKNLTKGCKTDSLRDRKKANMNLIECVIHYKTIIRFADEVTNLFTFSITAQFIIGVIIVCVSLFQMTLVSVMSFKFVSMLLYQGCVLMEIFLWCYYGNEIILKSDELTRSAYMCEWIEESRQFKKNLIFFMTRTQFPLKLYASGYFTLSLETFTAVVKSSWSYFAVLNQVHSK